ncbi:DUF6167 family protein [Nocardioides sp.]|uniref:DUF6167 family protein n=1 Tax=Nocardioides sp. TaxID=35761 RepID=UPI002EDB9319
MRRGLWFLAGAGAGVYAMVRGRRAAEALTADGLKDRLGALEVGARLFRDEVAQGRVEKESELRERLGLVPHGRPELEGGRHRAAPGAAAAEPALQTSSTTDEEGTT